MPREPSGVRRLSRPASRPLLVVVGHASRDLVADDPRGWRLGGSVAYVSLTAARLGIAVRAVIGLDGESAEASELGLLHGAGVELAPNVFAKAPVFRNVETPHGRRQECLAVGPRLHPHEVPEAWREADAWALVPVLDELSGGGWARLPARDATVALGWQGLLREARAGGPTRSRPPTADPLLERADVTVVSADDLDGVSMVDLVAHKGLTPLFPRRGQELVMTDAVSGGWLMVRSTRGWDIVPYDAAVADPELDQTGAGDVFLAAYLVTALDDTLLPPHRPAERPFFRLRVAAVAAAMSIEGPGITAIPTRAALQERLARAAG